VVILWLLLVVWLTDIGGYFAGKGIGGPKLAPRLSPKKTWAGLFGGMALAALGGAIVSLALDFGQAVMMATLSAGLAVIEQISDLLESGIKRRFGAKDSGHLIPGHGGLLDRVDGIVLVAASVGLAVLFNPQWGIA
ncbi:MAG: phosphatidate cytidylyltransferase, partial [Sphingomonadales bacterium]|nr:phosphatidate cytidylyltransferase [Sphingomonadales bacterium]